MFIVCCFLWNACELCKFPSVTLTVVRKSLGIFRDITTSHHLVLGTWMGGNCAAICDTVSQECRRACNKSEKSLKARQFHLISFKSRTITPWFLNLFGVQIQTPITFSSAKCANLVITNIKLLLKSNSAWLRRGKVTFIWYKLYPYQLRINILLSKIN